MLLHKGLGLHTVASDFIAMSEYMCCADYQEDLQHNGRRWHGGRQCSAPQHALMALPCTLCNVASAVRTRSPQDHVHDAPPQDVDKQGAALRLMT